MKPNIDNIFYVAALNLPMVDTMKIIQKFYAMTAAEKKEIKALIKRIKKPLESYRVRVAANLPAS